MSSAIQRVVAELTAALAEIEQAQIALTNAQATTAQALMAFTQATDGSSHELTKETRAYWAGASNKFDQAGRVLEASMRAIGAYQYHIAPGLARHRSIPVLPDGASLPGEHTGRRKARDRLLNVLARGAEDVRDVTKGVIDTTESVRQTYHKLPAPPAVTGTGTAAPPTPEIAPAQTYAPTTGDVASGIVMGALAGMIGFREMRRRRKELKAEDEQED